MSGLKIVLVGGGSYGWTPRLVCSILGNEFLNGSHVVLHDLNPEALDLTYRLALKYQALYGSDTTFAQTTDQAAALDGAHAVVVTISTGGLAAMQSDLELPEKYGIFQTVGDTVGPGGLFRALRGVPVFLGLARAMEERCPEAWMLNCSNPLSALTRVVAKETSIRAAGICHGVPGVAGEFAAFFGVPMEECAYANTGIDHCAFFTHFYVQGRPALEILEKKGVDQWLALPPEEAGADPVFGRLRRLRCGLRIGRRFGVLPAIGDRHLVEFFPGFLSRPEEVERHGLVRTTIADRKKSAVAARAQVERLLSGEEEVQRIEIRSDDVGAWIAALHNGPAVEDNLNAPNIGQIPQLPEGAVVETRGLLDATGLRPIVSPLPALLEAMVRPHVLREELTVEAALEGDFDKAVAVLSRDPLVTDPDTARPMLEELIAANREYLPRFG